ncbi:MAG: hypothetical protein JRI68_21220 [Deltaproteobacteria bacterium]|nr:hypothetical protein [Deltaproteobacteria bacterium]
MAIRCKACDNPIPSDDVNLDRMVAKCRKCHSVFDFGDQLGEKPAATVGRTVRTDVPMPEGLRVEHGEAGTFGGAGYRAQPGQRSEVTIVRRWFKPSQDIFLLFFAVVWNAFLVFWYKTAFTGDAPWIMIVFPLGHVAVGVGIGYRALAGLLNRTIVAVTPTALTVRHTPLPWLGKRDLAADELTQLYCMDKVHQTKQGSRTSYEVHAALANGSSLSIVKGLTDLGQALYIEQEVEKALNIEDVAVPGELES